MQCVDDHHRHGVLQTLSPDVEHFDGSAKLLGQSNPSFKPQHAIGIEDPHTRSVGAQEPNQAFDSRVIDFGRVLSMAYRCRQLEEQLRLFERFGRIPEEGDTYEWDGWEFKITEMDRRRISKVVVRAPTATMGDRSSGSTGK